MTDSGEIFFPGRGWAVDYLKAIKGTTTVSPTAALRPSTGGSGSGTATGLPKATTADIATLLGYVSDAKAIYKTGYATYDKAADKFTETATLKDDLKAAKALLAEIEKAQDKIAQGFADAKGLVFATGKVKTDTLAKLTAEEKTLDAKRVKYTGIVDDLETQIAEAAKPETNVLTNATKVAAETAAPLVTPVAPPVVNSNTAPNPSAQPGAWDTGVNGTARQTISKPQSGLALTYNVGSVKDAYFTNAKDYLKETTYKGNNPNLVTKAAQLWRSAGNSKGMFVMTNPVKNKSGITPAGGDPGNGAGWSYEAAWVKWGFQFLYNPATVSMTYQIGPAVDIGYLASGQEGANLMGTDGSFSTISFELILNRMSDMKYYNKNGLLTEAGKEQYGDHLPTARDQMLIYNRGTMYDLEYLLRTASGGTLIQQSWLRGITADLGFTGAVPIELHLGKNLRYWGTLASLEVNHTIFNEKMIPVFTSVNLTFARLIDPPKKPGTK